MSDRIDIADVNGLYMLRDAQSSRKTTAQQLKADGLVDIAATYTDHHFAVDAALNLLGAIGKKAGHLHRRVDVGDYGSMADVYADQMLGVLLVNYLIDCGFTPPGGTLADGPLAPLLTEGCVQ